MGRFTLALFTLVSFLFASVLEQLEREQIKVIEKVAPAVVKIEAVRENRGAFPGPFWFWHNRPPSETSVGSGVIVKLDPKKKKAYILTNAHVVRKAKKLRVSIDAKTVKEGKVVGVDEKTDIAVVEIPTEGIPDIKKRVAKLGDSDKLKVGQIVFAIGNPFGLERTVTMGIISALKRSINITAYENFIQTDAPINPGNSGGPLVNIKGEVIGINTAIIANAQGLGFAIPINLAKWVMEQLITEGKVTRGWLGVAIQEITPDLAEAFGVKEGVVVTRVIPGSPAEKAGIKPGDIIVAVNGEKVSNFRDLQLKIIKLKPGTEATITVLRKGKKKDIKVVIGELKDSYARGVSPMDLGLFVRDLSEEEIKSYKVPHGVLVERVEYGSPAYEAGLRPGDVILEVQGEPVKSAQEFYERLKELKEQGKKRVALRVKRGEDALYVALPLE